VEQPVHTRYRGLEQGFKPDTLDLSLVDRIETVTDGEAFEIARRLAKKRELSRELVQERLWQLLLRLANKEEYRIRRL
jgi:cysteine synthase A